eukprot:CAMPEP_0198277326 /NCGR_PEP_ID=MMETSP1447-20131203/65790_1 /TAXON_ID=420782 /ORGANISM="Chaetoceros dichaeta, Strain CCMP1751" /LENGTH=523 /DNA_ID=CAMNT_0043972341 /DNA_START=178 /DNA_END=1749 /DNA_ORIENTATION=+
MASSSSNDQDAEQSIITSIDINGVRNQAILDGKRRPTVPTSTFLFTALVGVPIWLTVLAPLTLIYQTGKRIFPPSTPHPQLKTQADDRGGVQEESFPELTELKPLNERKYDVVLLGGTGFTGSLVAMYLAEIYGENKSITWALAGRSPQKLAALKLKLSKKLQDSSMADTIDTIIVDTSIPSTIHNLVNDARVVISTAGPFSKYGSSVVEFCARYGTSYVDTTGEPNWSKEMTMKWDNIAQKSGAKIVSFCGLDSIPTNLIVHKLSEMLKKECNDDLVHVKCYNDMNAGISGGTVDTALSFAKGETKNNRYGFDPFLRKADGVKSSNKTINRSIASIRNYDKKGQWIAPWFMSSVNFELVKRTHAMKEDRGTNLIYEESVVHNNFKDAFVNWFGFIFVVTSILNPITRIPMEKILPKPGEGPTPKQLEHGYLLLTAEGEGANGNKAENALYIPGDPGYKETARMVAESGLCLALNAIDLPVKGGGFFSPAVAMGDVLLERLCKSGWKYASRILVKDGIVQSKL